MYSTGTLFMCSREGYFGVYFPKCTAEKEINTKMTLKRVHKHESTYIILFFTWHNKSVNDDKNDDRHTSTLCLTCSVYILLMTSQSIVDDFTMTRQLWHDHVNNDI